MSTLYLIRHGQASFGAADYDVLSELGAKQSRALGRFWAERRLALDAVYRGPRRRHDGTTQHLMNAASEAGATPPAAEVIDGLDEYPAFELLKHWMPILTRDDPELASLLSRTGAESGAARLWEVFERVIGKWARGELSSGDLESFDQFTDRVTSALHEIMASEGRGRSVAVITSGGPIAIAVRLALAVPDERTLRLAWVLANASVTELRYRDTELTLVGFNRIDHLPPELITYR